ncbi:tail fiber protein [Synechococcus phage S-WAM2]|uniref:Tail fiber protein n=1 Tax=Synechococcus phage S-WAM2 TaxID=1815522 RepID=A0A1D8KTA9_9CAUD|nr:tail fiber protein [Synechococcus phage S-WAM2]AOV61886.1 tail fiber protein [Synechococcus phage S-WAM2]
MSKILANQIANYGDDAPIEIKEGLNIPAGKPIQAAGSAGSSGQVLSTTGTTVQWVTPFDGDYNSLSNLPTIPAAQVNSDWNATSGVSRILNKPVIPPLPSVTTNAAGTAALSYNSVNGQFTYTPPDLSGFADGTNEANWDTAYGWGNHAAVGYLTAEVDTLQTVTSRNATTSNNITFSDSVELRFGSLSGGDLIITHLSSSNNSLIRNRNSSGSFIIDTATGSPIELRLSSGGEKMGVFNPNGSVELYYDNEKKFETTTEGVTITGSTGNNNLQVDGDALVIGGLTAGGLTYPEVTGNAGQILTSDGAGNVLWGSAAGAGGGIALSDLSVTTNAAGTAALSYNNISGVFTYTPPDLSGYLTSYAETDPVFSISPAASISTNQINNWNSAYSWGDHSAQGYLTSYTETDPVFSASDAAAVTAASISNWDTAYGWGDHAAAGYLTSQASVALNDVSDVTITSPTNGDVLTYSGGAWVNSASSAVVTISDTLPGGTPSAGDLWWESDTGRLKIYYQDVDSAQWVDTNPALQQDKIANSSAPATATSTGTAGEIRYDADYVYICVATNTWKRSALTTW